MDFTVVYVLVSTPEDCYYEQLLVSATSARKIMPDLRITILTDDKTKDTLTGFRGKITEVANEIKVIEFPLEVENKERSRLLKTSMRENIIGDFLYIDCDTIICNSFNSEELNKIDLGLVVDCHAYSDEYKAQEITRKKAEKIGFKDNLREYYNGGVIWSKDVPLCHEFFERWGKLYSETCRAGITIDQISLNKTNADMGGIIKELDGKWNCLAMHGARYLHDVNIIHYVGARYLSHSVYLLGNRDYFMDMKQQEKITTKIEEIIENPPSGFSPNVIIPLESDEFKVFTSSVFTGVESLFRKHPLIYAAINSICEKLINGKKRK